MVKVTVMRKKKAEWRSSVGNSQGQSSWPHSILQNCAVRDLWVKGCEEVPIFLGKVFWGFTVCFIVCIMLRKGLNGRMTMFYFHTMFTFQEPAHYLPLWRASCRSLLPQQGCTQNAEGLVMKSHIQNILVLPTRCRFGWFDDVCLGTSKTPTRKNNPVHDCLCLQNFETPESLWKVCCVSWRVALNLWNMFRSLLLRFLFKCMAQPPTASPRARAHAAKVRRHRTTRASTPSSPEHVAGWEQRERRLRIRKR